MNYKRKSKQFAETLSKHFFQQNSLLLRQYGSDIENSSCVGICGSRGTRKALNALALFGLMKNFCEESHMYMLGLGWFFSCNSLLE